MAKDLPSPDDTIWFVVFVAEFIVIFVINASTAIAFARNRRLRKRTTYLIINLTAADLLVGAVSGPLDGYHEKIKVGGHGFSWRAFLTVTINSIFPLASQVNLSLIALERVHATLYPFRHCLIGKRTYHKIIICSWLVALLLVSAAAVLFLYKTATGPYRYVWVSYTALTVLVLIIAYFVIISNVKSNPHYQNSGSVA